MGVYGKKPDRRKFLQTDHLVCISAAARKSVSAALQSGRYGDRGKDTWHQCAGVGGRQLFFELFDSGILYGFVQRICDSGCTDLRRKALFSDARLRDEQHDPCGGSIAWFCFDHIGFLPPDPDFDPHTGKYSGRRISVSCHYFYWHSVYRALQPGGRNPACTRGQQKPIHFSCHIDGHQYIWRSALHSRASYGRGRSSGGDDHGTGDLRNLLPGLYEKAFPDSCGLQGGASPGWE